MDQGQGSKPWPKPMAPSRRKHAQAATSTIPWLPGHARASMSSTQWLQGGYERRVRKRGCPNYTLERRSRAPNANIERRFRVRAMASEERSRSDSEHTMASEARSIGDFGRRWPRSQARATIPNALRPQRQAHATFSETQWHRRQARASISRLGPNDIEINRCGDGGL